mgnify:CR=1 FL=1
MRNAGSNCTFMELKYHLSYIGIDRWSVLIVPLWNWNLWFQSLLFYFFPVLIVPLWNWNLNLIVALIQNFSSNCTFMELKFCRGNCNYKSTSVLIVPLWNWNYIMIDVTFDWEVLIVPLWNWNMGFVLAQIVAIMRSNCTFMELKCR